MEEVKAVYNPVAEREREERAKAHYATMNAKLGVLKGHMIELRAHGMSGVNAWTNAVLADLIESFLMSHGVDPR